MVMLVKQIEVGTAGRPVLVSLELMKGISSPYGIFRMVLEEELSDLKG